MLRLFFFFPAHYSDCDYIIICIVYDYYYYYCSIFSPDDIHKLYSGRTVEINNTDAEGRLVLVNFLYFFSLPFNTIPWFTIIIVIYYFQSDGVAFCQKDLKATIILDMATLTGAQVRWKHRQTHIRNRKYFPIELLFLSLSFFLHVLN